MRDLTNFKLNRTQRQVQSLALLKIDDWDDDARYQMRHERWIDKNARRVN